MHMKVPMCWFVVPPFTQLGGSSIPESTALSSRASGLLKSYLLSVRPSDTSRLVLNTVAYHHRCLGHRKFSIRRKFIRPHDLLAWPVWLLLTTNANGLRVHLILGPGHRHAYSISEINDFSIRFIENSAGVEKNRWKCDIFVNVTTVLVSSPFFGKKYLAIRFLFIFLYFVLVNWI